LRSHLITRIIILQCEYDNLCNNIKQKFISIMYACVEKKILKSFEKKALAKVKRLDCNRLYHSAGNHNDAITSKIRGNVRAEILPKRNQAKKRYASFSLGSGN